MGGLGAQTKLWCDVSKYLEVPIVPTLYTRNNVREWLTKLGMLPISMVMVQVDDVCYYVELEDIVWEASELRAALG